MEYKNRKNPIGREVRRNLEKVEVAEIKIRLYVRKKNLFSIKKK